ncbi:Hypothetical predicted protein [Octopus vulgaris]|uniref:Uncharacterized protein n=1 Tax=Octopus vulgaris TaxID=6645 RepID=A0AA36AYV0_OCTVU|nr:Hypothetical predicted protein [Octopus vulgaris]
MFINKGRHVCTHVSRSRFQRTLRMGSHFSLMGLHDMVGATDRQGSEEKGKRGAKSDRGNVPFYLVNEMSLFSPPPQPPPPPPPPPPPSSSHRFRFSIALEICSNYTYVDIALKPVIRLYIFIGGKARILLEISYKYFVVVAVAAVLVVVVVVVTLVVVFVVSGQHEITTTQTTKLCNLTALL